MLRTARLRPPAAQSQRPQTCVPGAQNVEEVNRTQVYSSFRHSERRIDNSTDRRDRTGMVSLVLLVIISPVCLTLLMFMDVLPNGPSLSLEGVLMFLILKSQSSVQRNKMTTDTKNDHKQTQNVHRYQKRPQTDTELSQRGSKRLQRYLE